MTCEDLDSDMPTLAEWIDELQKQISELQDELVQERLTRESLQQEFAKLRYLNRQEVEKIFEGLLGICPVGFELEPFISELCNLALPDRDKIVELIKKSRPEIEKFILAKNQIAWYLSTEVKPYYKYADVWFEHLFKIIIKTIGGK